MTGIASVLRYVAFTLMALFGLLGGLFVAGYAFEEPGGWAAVGLTASWVLPMAALSVFALLRPTTAAPVFVWVTAGVALATLADSLFGVVPRDDWGPVLAVIVFSTGVSLAFLGLHRPALAGLLMVALGLVQLVATALGFVVHEGLGEGPGPGAMLGTSSGVVVVPLLVIGALFLLAGSLGHDSLRPRPTPPLTRVH